MPNNRATRSFKQSGWLRKSNSTYPVGSLLYPLPDADENPDDSPDEIGQSENLPSQSTPLRKVDLTAVDHRKGHK